MCSASSCHARSVKCGFRVSARRLSPALPAPLRVVIHGSSCRLANWDTSQHFAPPGARVGRPYGSTDAVRDGFMMHTASEDHCYPGAHARDPMDAEPSGQRHGGSGGCACGQIWTQVPQYNEMLDRLFSLWEAPAASGESFKLVLATLPPSFFSPSSPLACPVTTLA